MWKRRAFVITALTILYFSSRLINLTLIPIFTDEAIYIRWGQIALQDPVHRFISLEDGKQPLFIWLMLPMLKFVSDPLIAGRLVSVFSGAITLAGLVALSWKLFGEKIGWISGFLYIVSPFFLLYDRLALYDSLTSAIYIWSLFLAILLAQTLRLDAALLLGMSIGAGLLTKSSAQFSLILLPATLLLVNLKVQDRTKNLVRWLGLALVVGILSLMIQNILRLAPLYHMVGLKNLTFVVSFREFLSDPLSRFWGNLRGLTDWSVSYLTWPILGLLILGFFAGVKKNWRKIVILGIWSIFPFLSLGLFGKILYPRFLLFMIIILLPIISLGIGYLLTVIKSYLYKSILILLLFIYPLYFSSTIIFIPLNSPLPKVDRFQFFDDWPSGYGINEVIDLIKVRAETQKIFVGTEGTFGLTPTALNIYLKDNTNIKVKGYWPISDGILELIEVAETGKPTYVLFKDTQKPNPEWPLEFIVKYQKGRGEVYMSLYRINSKK